MHRFLTLLSFNLALIVCAHVLAAEPDQQDIEARLQQLEAELQDYRKMLETTRGKKSDIEESLKHNEKNISDLINKIDNIENELDTNQDKVTRLTREQSELITAKSEQQDYIERQVRAAFEIGNQEYLKVLLNQEDPDEMARMLIYYDYFNEARAKQIQTYNGVLEDLDRVSLALATEKDLLQKNRASLSEQKTALAVSQANKKKVLRSLVARIRDAGSEIKRLEQDREQLEGILERLEASLANLPAPGDSEPFASMQGKLTLPVAGTISQRFGKQRNQGKLRWDGVFIDAREGEPVYAVHYGRVVFSDWLRGFGLLLIVSHGDGYMSLYGHNQALYRETGDWVTAGEVIATVGDSGGQNKTGLYFEIRIAGEPTDPMKWCMARTKGAA